MLRWSGPEPAPGLVSFRAAVGQPAAAERASEVVQRLVAVPPVGVDIAAAALEEQRAAGVVEAELHRQGVALVRSAAGGSAVGGFAEAEAVAPMIGGDDPAHGRNPFR